MNGQTREKLVKRIALKWEPHMPHVPLMEMRWHYPTYVRKLTNIPPHSHKGVLEDDYR